MLKVSSLVTVRRFTAGINVLIHPELLLRSEPSQCNNHTADSSHEELLSVCVLSLILASCMYACNFHQRENSSTLDKSEFKVKFRIRLFF